MMTNTEDNTSIQNKQPTKGLDIEKEMFSESQKELETPTTPMTPQDNNSLFNFAERKRKLEERLRQKQSELQAKFRFRKASITNELDDSSAATTTTNISPNPATPSNSHKSDIIVEDITQRNEGAVNIESFPVVDSQLKIESVPEPIIIPPVDLPGTIFITLFCDDQRVSLNDCYSYFN